MSDLNLGTSFSFLESFMCHEMTIRDIRHRTAQHPQ